MNVIRLGGHLTLLNNESRARECRSKGSEDDGGELHGEDNLADVVTDLRRTVKDGAPEETQRTCSSSFK